MFQEDNQMDFFNFFYNMYLTNETIIFYIQLFDYLECGS
jgi:hypothetical protein